MSEEIKEEFNEDVETEAENEELFEETAEEETTQEEGEIEFDYDDDGNIIIPEDDESEESQSEEEAEKESAEPEAKEDDAADEKGQDEPEKAEEKPNEEVVEPASAPDEKDAEIKRLKKALAERDAQIKDTLKSLGADENEGVAGLEKLAAEALDQSVEDYRKDKAKRLEQEEAMRVVRQQRFDEKIRADLLAVQQAYPETKQYKSVLEFPNFEKFSKYRDLGLAPDEAYIAANPKGVINSVAAAAQQQARNLSNTKDHLRSNVPVGSKDKSISISKKEMSEYKSLFPNMSDKEIVALYKRTNKK